jgi:hypothetical protein
MKMKWEEGMKTREARTKNWSKTLKGQTTLGRTRGPMEDNIKVVRKNERKCCLLKEGKLF